jgi:hypothetical protein
MKKRSIGSTEIGRSIPLRGANLLDPQQLKADCCFIKPSPCLRQIKKSHLRGGFFICGIEECGDRISYATPAQPFTLHQITIQN